MYRFNHSLLPSAFDAIYSKVREIHHYNTRSAAKQSYYLPKAKTNYGILDFKDQRSGTQLMITLKLFLFLTLNQS